jgi:hypothetical protein
MNMSGEEPTSMSGAQMADGGHLYMQTNEVQNCVIHYARASDGKVTEVDRTLTGGAGSGTYKPINNAEVSPNAFEAANSVILSPDNRFLFTTNGGDNSVSSFAVGPDGSLTLIDALRTGNVVTGRSGTASALAYSPSHKVLYVLHSFGPDHLRLMSVGDDGKLTLRPERGDISTATKTDRTATMATLTPDEKFLVVGTTFDYLPKPNPDGSPILWIEVDGAPHSIASNAPDPDGLIVFEVGQFGALGEPMFQDGGGGSPWNIQFLHHRPDTFVLGYAVSDGMALGRINEDGRLEIGPITKVDTSDGVPSELCWCTITPDDKLAIAVNFGYGYMTSYWIKGNLLSIAKDPANPKIPHESPIRALNTNYTSSPADNWISPDGSYVYLIYPNASKLIGYAIQPDGSLDEVTRVPIPFLTPQGLTGF